MAASRFSFFRLPLGFRHRPVELRNTVRILGTLRTLLDSRHSYILDRRATIEFRFDILNLDTPIEPKLDLIHFIHVQVSYIDNEERASEHGEFLLPRDNRRFELAEVERLYLHS